MRHLSLSSVQNADRHRITMFPCLEARGSFLRMFSATSSLVL